MSKDDLIDMQGTVIAVHSGGLYRVQCDGGHEVLAGAGPGLERVESASQVTVIGERDPEPNEGAHDFYVDLHCSLAVKHTGKHSNTLFSKGKRRVASTAPNHNLISQSAISYYSLPRRIMDEAAVPIQVGVSPKT